MGSTGRGRYGVGKRAAGAPRGQATNGNNGTSGQLSPNCSGAAVEQSSRTEVQRLARTLSALERISHALTTTTDGVSVLMQTIAKTVAEVFDCSFVFLVVRNGPDELSTIYAPPPVGDGGGPAGLTERGYCINEHMLFGRGSMQVPCLARGACPCCLTSDVMTVPMSRDGVLEGSISFQLSGNRDLEYYDASILEILANQASVAIRNARLFEESQHLRAQAESHYRMAVEQRQEAERRRRELELAEDEIDSMAREQIISAERERIARELHDEVAQTLTSIGLNLQWCQKHLPPDSPLQDRLVCMKELARAGLYEVRKAILGLSPMVVAELGLSGALGKLADDFKQVSMIPIKFESSGHSRPLRNEVETAIYQVCQEALYNVFKHAHAQHTDVRLAFEPDAVVLTVADDGIGVNPEAARQPVTFGLKIMRARVEEVGGSLIVSRGLVRGASVVVRIPG